MFFFQGCWVSLLQMHLIGRKVVDELFAKYAPLNTFQKDCSDFFIGGVGF
jgi:hypothetical protein